MELSAEQANALVEAARWLRVNGGPSYQWDNAKRLEQLFPSAFAAPAATPERAQEPSGRPNREALLDAVQAALAALNDCEASEDYQSPVNRAVRALLAVAVAPAPVPPVLGDEREPESECVATYYLRDGEIVGEPTKPAPPAAPRFRTEQFWAPTLRRRDSWFVMREDARQPTDDVADAILFDSQPACDRWVREHGTDDYRSVPLELKIAVESASCGRDRGGK